MVCLIVNVTPLKTFISIASATDSGLHDGFSVTLGPVKRIWNMVPRLAMLNE
jgi:hypothetical protein